jgi:hypothetical protein
VTEEAFMKTVIAAALAAVTLGGCIAVPVYGPPRAYVAPPAPVYYYGQPYRHHHHYYR